MDHLLVSWMEEYPSTESRWIVRSERKRDCEIDGRNGEGEFLCCSDFSDGHLGRRDECPAVWVEREKEKNG